MSNVELTEEQQKLLQKARDTYGNKNQILVCMEELNELSCVLAKYPRYENSDEAISELQEKILDEVADVYIILEHVKAISELSKEMIEFRIDKKLDRVNRWLNHSESIEETVRDREVTRNMCIGCIFEGKVTEELNEHCHNCKIAQQYEGCAPKYTKK